MQTAKHGFRSARSIRPPSAVGSLALLLTLLALATTPLALSKYVATGKGTAGVRIAQFSAPALVNRTVGTNVLVYFHRNNYLESQWAPKYDLRFTNTSEVAARYRLQIYNVFNDRARYNDNWSWTNPNDRRLQLTLTPDYPVAGAYVRARVLAIGWSTAGGRTPLLSTDRRYYSVTAGQEGSRLMPVDSPDIEDTRVGFLVEFTGENTTANLGGGDDTDGTGFSRDIAYRINYNLSAKQVD